MKRLPTHLTLVSLGPDDDTDFVYKREVALDHGKAIAEFVALAPECYVEKWLRALQAHVFARTGGWMPNERYLRAGAHALPMQPGGEFKTVLRTRTVALHLSVARAELLLDTVHVGGAVQDRRICALSPEAVRELEHGVPGAPVGTFMPLARAVFDDPRHSKRQGPPYVHLCAHSAFGRGVDGISPEQYPDGLVPVASVGGPLLRKLLRNEDEACVRAYRRIDQGIQVLALEQTAADRWQARLYTEVLGVVQAHVESGRQGADALLARMRQRADAVLGLDRAIDRHAPSVGR